MSDNNNTNTLILLMIGGGLYYIKNAYTEEEKNTKEESTNMTPYILAFILVFSMKKEIEETVSKERIYTLIAITLASYLTTINADILHIFGSVFASLIMLPAIREYES